MELKISLDETWQDDYGDQMSIARLIQRTVASEIERWVKKEIKDLLKAKEKEAHAVLKQAVNRDWKQVAKVLEQIREQGVK